jgi:peptidyl-dipeptidase Dcp
VPPGHWVKQELWHETALVDGGGGSGDDPGRIGAQTVFDAPSPLPFHAPDFTRIKDGDFQPAIEAGIALRRAEIAKIANNPAAPTFANTIEALERSGQMLDRVLQVFSALTSANTNDTLDEVDRVTAPKLTALNDEVAFDARLFAPGEKTA